MNHGDTWFFHKGTNAPLAGWQSVSDAALDADWASGPGGFGYGDAGIVGEATTLADMINRYTTVFIRRSFDVASAFESDRHLFLKVDYDDGFVAYLDGVEIRRANTTNAVGSTVTFNQTTGANSHEASCCNTPNPATTYDLGPVGTRLAPGTHTLALVGLNQAPGSSDFHLIADLLVGGAQGSVVMGPLSTIIQSNAVALIGSNAVPGATRVTVNGDDASVNAAQSTWSRLHPLAPGVNKIFVAATDASGAVLASTNHMIISEASSTSVGGTLRSNTTWTSAMGIIHVTNRVVVTNGISLNVESGCVLLFDNGTGIFGTNGSISLLGTANAPIYLLPGDVMSTNWGELAISGTSGTMLLQHAESISGHFEVFDGAMGTFEDCSLHDYWTASPAIVHTLGSPNTVTLNMKRCYVARYQEVLSQLATNHIEDSLFEYLGYSGDGIDFDYGQEGSYIRRCTLRRGQIFNTDAIDMGEFGANGTHVLIDSCLLHDFIDKGVSMGVQVYVTVTNTLIYNTDSGFGVKDNSEAGIYNCTVANVNFGFHEYNKANSGATTGGGHVTNSFNNIVWTVADTTVSLANGSTFVGTYSDLFQPWIGEGNISADPLFVNPAAHDYRVSAGSPTIGTGLGGANMGVTFPVGGIPAAPLRLAVLASGTNDLVLTWNDDSDNEDSVEIQRSLDGVSWTTVGSAGANATNFTDLTATVGTKYYYRARAVNTLGASAFSNTAGGARQAPIQYVGGPISGNVTWASGSHYVVTSAVSVASSATLNIDAGVTVCFNAGLGMTIANGGRLLANGASNAPILFTRSPTNAGTWTGLTIGGGPGSPETQISFARFEFTSQNPCLQVSAGTVFFDHLTFGNRAASYIHVDGASFVIQNCEFPTATAGFELVHGTGGIKAGGHGIFTRNFFGSPIGYNDVVDFTGGNRPGPIVHFIDNVLVGASDDMLDLDGTDAWVEGNIFLHCHKNGSPDTSSPISGSDDAGSTSEITAIGNIFYDVDHAVMAKGGNFYTLINNTIVHQNHSGGTDVDGAVLCMADDGFSEGAGMYVEGNIIDDVEKLLRFYTNSAVTFTNNVMQLPWTGPGGNNTSGDPLFVHKPLMAETVFTNWAQAQIMKQWLQLQPGSPAIGTGPNGQDRGGVIPLGASISGEPASPTSQTNATLTVGILRAGSGIPAGAAQFPLGSGYTHYKWRLDGGAWSAERTIATPITISNLTAGAHYVEVTGKRDSALYQDDSLFGPDSVPSRSATWIVGGASIDTDGDGMADDWELGYGLNPNDPADAGQDADGDGMTNLQEYQAGTDPRGSASRLYLHVAIEGSNTVITFAAAADKTYTVESRDSFGTGSAWQLLQAIPAGPNRTVAVTNAPTGSARFFRIATP